MSNETLSSSEARIYDRMSAELRHTHARIMRRTLERLARVNPNARAVDAIGRFADAAAAEALSLGRARRQ